MSLLFSALLLTASPEPLICPHSSVEKCNNEDVNGQMRATPRKIAKRADLCLYKTNVKCVVVASGMIKIDADSPKVAWQKVQLYDGARPTEMVMAFDISKPAAVFIGQVQSHGTLWSPELIDAGVDKYLLHIRGVASGTGQRNNDVLYLANMGVWQQIDLSQWQEQAAKKLPKGYGIWKGVRYEFGSMFTHASVWHDDDANCCPTGGEAFINFNIKGNVLVLEDLDFTPKASNNCKK